jgi:hypothetical protein
MENRSESALSVRTRGIDLLSVLRKYEGGYNITDNHLLECELSASLKF